MNKKKIIEIFTKDTFFYGFGLSLNNAILIIIFPFIARHFTVSDIAIIDFFLIFLSLTTVVVTFGLDSSLGRFYFEAKGIIDTYFAKYKRVREFMEELKELANKQEYVETMHGRKVFLPNITHSNFQVRSAAERTAINAPIQGTAADIIKIAMINIKEWLIRENIHNVFMIMQVHDELVFEIEDSDIHRYGDKISDLMGSAEKLNVPLLVNTFSGSNWQET